MLTLIITTALAHGLDPILFHAILWQESRLRSSAVSSTGDIGIGQISPRMAQELRLDRGRLGRDVKYALEASASILARLKAQYGRKEPKIWWSRYHSRNMVLRFRYHTAVTRWM